jgi:hypothetical protein
LYKKASLSFFLVFEDDVEDVPAAPIDDWIFPMVLLGIAMMVYYTKKKQCTEL